MKIGSEECKEGGNYGSARRVNTPSGTKQEGDKLLPPSFPPRAEHPFTFRLSPPPTQSAHGFDLGDSVGGEQRGGRGRRGTEKEKDRRSRRMESDRDKASVRRARERKGRKKGKRKVLV